MSDRNQRLYECGRFAGHALQHALEVLFEVAAQRLDALWNGASKAARQIIDEPWIESHGAQPRHPSSSRQAAA